MPSTPLAQWIGREREDEDHLSPAPARRMLALLDRDPEGLHQGSVLPPGWHWLYLNHGARRSLLGEDGHEKRGGFLPPVPLPRRMWAGGRIRFHAPLELGRRVRRLSRVTDLREKEGRTGPLVFVTVRHEIFVDEEVAVEEERDLVYREPVKETALHASAPGREREPAGKPTWTETFVPDVVTLFRFSALTFNGHRIHYDHRYATKVEGYPNLVVHGPLLALLLLDAGERWLGEPPRFFTYRAVSPLFCDELVHLGGRPEEAGGSSAGTGGSKAHLSETSVQHRTELWAAHPERGLVMSAKLTS